METAKIDSSPRRQAVPEGYNSVSPWVISRDTAKLIEFATAAFQAEEIGRLADDHGVIQHAEFRIGDSVILAFDSRPGWPDTPAFLRLYVDDGTAAFQRALDAGATPVTEMTPLFWGDRVGRVRDPLGNLWWIQEHAEQVDQTEMARRAGDPIWIERMKYVQSSLRISEDSGR